MTYMNLLSEVKGKTAVITINRPDKLNALNKQTLEELKDVFTKLDGDDNILAVVITGAGEKAFVAGADISELNKLDEQSSKLFALCGQDVFNRISNLSKPVIAAVNGFALGGGCELALACHIRLASENAKFGQPEVNLGTIPGFGGTQRLARLINPDRAMEMILSGDMVSADEALRIGLVNHVYPQSELMAKCLELAGKISSKAPVAVRNAVKSVNITNELSLEEGLKFEAQMFADSCRSEDFNEGTSAFLQKRKPEFKGR